MSLKHAILGFLSFKPMTGYDLKKKFDRSVRHFWPANQSQIYRSLADLKDEGLVDHEVFEREDRLDMKVYHTTPAGIEELHLWLSTPLPQHDYREAFLIQVYFGGMLEGKALIPLLQREIKGIEEAQSQYVAMFRMYSEKFKSQGGSQDLFFSMLPLEYGIKNNQACLVWLKNVLARLENGCYVPLDMEQLAG